MSPLSAIPQHAIQAYGLRPRVDLAPAEVLPLPVELQKAGATQPAADSF